VNTFRARLLYLTLMGTSRSLEYLLTWITKYWIISTASNRIIISTIWYSSY